jgi:hypothetical protein
MAQEDKTLGELFSDLSRDTATLVRHEVRLASAELSAKASRVGRHAAFIAVGGAVAYAGLLGIMAGLVVVLQTAGLTWWASAFIVGVGFALVGYLLAQRGISALGREQMAPRQTIATLKEGAEWVKGERA